MQVLGSLLLLFGLLTVAGVSAASAATPTIAPVGSMADSQGTGVSSLSVSPKTVGDALVLTVKVTTSSATVSSVSGGGASWTKVSSYEDATSHDLEIWLGTVTAAGSTTINLAYSASVGSSSIELIAQEFTAGLGGASVWAKDVAAGQSNASSTTVASPTLTAASAGELYVSYSRCPNQVFAGSTTGVTYDPTALGNMFLFDSNLTGSLSPTSTQSPASTSSAIGAVIRVSTSTPPVPTVTTISPTNGPTGGGTAVSVTGTNFATGDTVHFGTVAATGVTIASASSLTATAPAGTGVLDVTVTGPGGTSATSAADRFTYVAAPPVPTVTTISPTNGPTGGGTAVSVTGTNFATGDTVHFGTVAATGVTIASASSLTATAPAGTGVLDVTVTGPGGTSATSAADRFTYVAAPPVPTVTTISPTNGPTGGGTAVSVTGTNFATGDTVHFGTVAATGVTIASASSLTATAPAGTGVLDVTVTGPGGTSATNAADRFTYVTASGPTLIQTASGSGVDAQVGGSVPINITLGSPCASGDSLVAMVTVGQNSAQGGMVSAVPTGWQRLFEHSPTDNSPYQGWFALSSCGGTRSVSFTVSAPTDSSGTSGSVVVSEYSGLPRNLALDFAVNDGRSAPQSSADLPGLAPSGPGELVLTALSFYGSSGNAAVPSGWNPAGAQPGSLPAFVYSQVSSGSTPDAAFTWGGASPYEVTMVALKDAGSRPTPNVVQEAQTAFGSVTSVTTILPQGLSSGDALVALIGTDTPGTSVTSVSGGGVTWQRAGSGAQAGNGGLEIWVGFGSAGTSGATSVAASLSGVANGHLVVAELTGVGGLDASQASSGSSSTASGVALAAQPGDVALAAVVSNASAIVVHPQPDWSTFSLSSASSADEWMAGTTTTSPVPSWQLGTSTPWLVVQVDLLAGTVTPPPAPTVSSVSPAGGPSNGGTLVTVSGTGFASGDTVSFGAVAATGVTVTSATVISVNAPAGSGTVDVRVSGPHGTSGTTVGDRYTYTTQSGPPTIAPVGSMADSQGTGVSSLSVSPKTVGDALVLTVKVTTSSATVSSVSGGGASWTKVSSYEDATSHDLEIWLGTVTAAGSTTINLAYSASVGSSSIELIAQEFTAGLGGASVWAKDVAAGQSNASSTTVASPTLTAASAGELYVSYSRCPNQVFAGSTTGVTYDPTALGNMFLFDSNLTGSLSPTSTQSPASTSSAIGAVIRVS